MLHECLTCRTHVLTFVGSVPFSGSKGSQKLEPRSRAGGSKSWEHCSSSSGFCRNFSEFSMFLMNNGFWRLPEIPCILNGAPWISQPSTVSPELHSKAGRKISWELPRIKIGTPTQNSPKSGDECLEPKGTNYWGGFKGKQLRNHLLWRSPHFENPKGLHSYENARMEL